MYGNRFGVLTLIFVFGCVWVIYVFRHYVFR